jgi:hypothetical protein
MGWGRDVVAADKHSKRIGRGAKAPVLIRIFPHSFKTKPAIHPVLGSLLPFSSSGWSSGNPKLTNFAEVSEESAFH